MKETRERVFLFDTQDVPTPEKLNMQLVERIQPWVEELTEEGWHCKEGNLEIWDSRVDDFVMIGRVIIRVEMAIMSNGNGHRKKE